MVASCSDAVAPFINDHVLAFNDAHLAMIFANAGDSDKQAAHERSMHAFVTQPAAQNVNSRLTKTIGIPMCEAIADFRREAFDRCFERLYDVRRDSWNIGGSHAQVSKNIGGFRRCARVNNKHHHSQIEWSLICKHLQRDVFTQLCVASGLRSSRAGDHTKAL